MKVRVMLSCTFYKPSFLLNKLIHYYLYLKHAGIDV